MVKVSVVMPNYNKKEYISLAIDSVLKQTHSDFELVIVDDGSTDGSQNIIEQYAKKDNRIIVLNHEKNVGISKSCNDGIKSSKGEAICLLGSDDIYSPEKLELQLSALHSSNDTVVYCDWFSLSKDGIISRENHKLLEETGFIFPSLLGRSMIANAQVMIPKWCLNTLGRMFDESLDVCEDYDLLLALSRRFSFVYVPKSLYGYRIYDDNVSSKSNRRWRYAQKAKVLRRYVDDPILSKSQRLAAYRNLVMCDVASRNYGKIAQGLVTRKNYLIAMNRALRSRARLQ